MRYELMHRDEPAAVVELTALGNIARTVEVLDRGALPVCAVRDGRFVPESLELWWADRPFPSKRPMYYETLEWAGAYSSLSLLPRSMGLSLSDQFWIRGEGSGARWADVNFFDNPFPGDVGDMLLGSEPVPDPDVRSPDVATDGVMPKRWTVREGRRVLVKGGGPHGQEPFNEVAASMLMDALGVGHVEYTMCEGEGGRAMCQCDNFLDGRTELVTASCMYYTLTPADPRDLHGHLLRCCSEAGMDVTHALDEMIVVDYLMLNTDRHFKNFGFVRDAETLEWLGPAPVFDTGMSLQCGEEERAMLADAEPACKPFAGGFEAQLSLATDLGWVDFEALKGALPEVRGMLEDFPKSLPAGRIDRMMRILERRAEKLERRAGLLTSPRGSGGRR